MKTKLVLALLSVCVVAGSAAAANPAAVAAAADADGVSRRARVAVEEAG